MEDCSGSLGWVCDSWWGPWEVGNVALWISTCEPEDWDFFINPNICQVSHFHTWYKLYFFCCLVAKSCPTLRDPWTVTLGAPPSMGFSRQEYWSGLPFPSPGELPTQELNQSLFHRQADSLPLGHQKRCIHSMHISFLPLEGVWKKWSACCWKGCFEIKAKTHELCEDITNFFRFLFFIRWRMPTFWFFFNLVRFIWSKST